MPNQIESALISMELEIGEPNGPAPVLTMREKGLLGFTGNNSRLKQQAQDIERNFGSEQWLLVFTEFQ